MNVAQTPQAFRSFQEVREPRSVGTPDKADNRRHPKQVKYYLEDAYTGEHVLCVVGQETSQGDAHYCYKSTKQFNQHGYDKLLCHNRRTLLRWLDTIIALSSRKTPPLVRIITGCIPLLTIHRLGIYADFKLTSCMYHAA